MYDNVIKDKAITLRSKGMNYQEINDYLNARIPKSTLATWCAGLLLSPEHNDKIRIQNLNHLVSARKLAAQAKHVSREKYLSKVKNNNEYLKGVLENRHVAKIALAMLYLGEGAKGAKRASIGFGNSDPNTVSFFLRLLRMCYAIDESKFRCTVQCRADQNTSALEFFWSEITMIPCKQFYASRIDKRTVGQVSQKPQYKGVCRIDYFSAEIFHDIMTTINILI